MNTLPLNLSLESKETAQILWPTQIEAVSKMFLYDKGRIVQTTGTGKTKEAAHRAYLELFNGFKLIVVKSPRIMLTNQIAEEFMKHFGICNDVFKVKPKYESILIHSGHGVEFKNDENASIKDILNNLKNALESGVSIKCTSSNKEMEDKLKRSISKDIPFIIFTTYHSNDKVNDSLSRLKLTIDLDLNDESQYLVRPDFYTLIDSTKNAKKQFFFTATEKVTSTHDGFGHNNEERFGPRIFELPYCKALKLGLVTKIKPKPVHAVNESAFTDKDTYDKNVGDIIKAAYIDLESETNPIFGAKMLVAADGQGHIYTFLDSQEYVELRELGVNILTIHSASKDLITLNGEKLERKDFYKTLRRISNDMTQKLILVHHDILSEGIDIQGLHGVLILRNMNRTTLYQTVGRIVRIFRANPALKPHGVVLFPELPITHELYSNFASMLTKLLEEGYIPSEQIQFITPPPSPKIQPEPLTEEISFKADEMTYNFYTSSLWSEASKEADELYNTLISLPFIN